MIDRLRGTLIPVLVNYPVVLDGSGLVLAVLLLGYPAVQDKSGLVPMPLVLEKG